MTTISRREILQRVAYMMGGAISAPAILGVLQGCAASARSKPVFLTERQVDTVTEIAEIIIPRTDTPGAKDVGVPAFIDLMLQQTYDAEDRARFIAGWNEFEARAEVDYKRTFLKLEPADRVALVQRVHDEALAAERARPPQLMVRVRRPFILMMKELTLLGFFCSEVGVRQIQQYDPVPGAYHGCVPLAQAGNGKAWAGDATMF